MVLGTLSKPIVVKKTKSTSQGTSAPSPGSSSFGFCWGVLNIVIEAAIKCIKSGERQGTRARYVSTMHQHISVIAAALFLAGEPEVTNSYLSPSNFRTLPMLYAHSN